MNPPDTTNGNRGDMNDNTSTIFTNEISDNRRLNTLSNPSATAVSEVHIPVSEKEMEMRNREGFVNPDEVNKVSKISIKKILSDDPDAKNRSGNSKPASYAAKKTAAQGMMDIALLTSNANQLKNLVEYQDSSLISFYFIFALILISLGLQVGVGVGLIFKGRYDSKGKDKAAAARVNKYVMSAVFLITVINIFIAAFSMGSAKPAPTAVQSAPAAQL
ncbi:ninjurin-1-like [Athalia rosae]|uniref:ninjurin-1-like n=1 Tax=Athalia rosae TaxID=37344 RepID=UPI000626A949|nr:ninjurin-1-like [Athalia rosae]